MEYVSKVTPLPNPEYQTYGNGANGALLALSSCVITCDIMMPIPVVTTTPLLTDAHSTGTGPEVARWIFSPKGAAKARFKKLAETDVDGGYNNGGSDGSCNSVSDRDDDGNGKDGGELVCDDHQWTRRRFLRHRPLICNAYRAGLCQHHHHHHHHHYRHLHLHHRPKSGLEYIQWHCKICLSDLSFFSEKMQNFAEGSSESFCCKSIQKIWTTIFLRISLLWISLKLCDFVKILYNDHLQNICSMICIQVFADASFQHLEISLAGPHVTTIWWNKYNM